VPSSDGAALDGSASTASPPARVVARALTVLALPVAGVATDAPGAADAAGAGASGLVLVAATRSEATALARAAASSRLSVTVYGASR
jgi:hypothetical protein